MTWMHNPTGAPPFSDAGGMQAMMPDNSGYLHLNLTPGNYVALCHVPDAATGKGGYLQERGLIPLPPADHAAQKDVATNLPLMAAPAS